MPRCPHDIGWVAMKNPPLFVDPGFRVILGRSRTNRILLKCNRADCSMVRYGTFMKNGAFVRFGRIRQAKPGEL